MSSMSWVNTPEDRVAESVASTLARFFAILRIVFLRSMMSGFGMRSIDWLMIVSSRSLNLAPQPPFLAKQRHPPPYSCLPLIIASAPHFGHFRRPSRQRYLLSNELHDPNPVATRNQIGRASCRERV